MQISTTRFGSIEFEADDILLFPHGLIGFGECRHWLLLADLDNESVGWLQSVARPDTALAVVSPRRFAPDYQVRLTRGEWSALQFEETDESYVLSVVGQSDGRLTLNLRAPILINLNRRVGRQVVVNDQQPLTLAVGEAPAALRKSA